MTALTEPLFTAEEVRAAEAAYPGYPESMAELMERAGSAVAEAALRRFPDAHTVTVVCGGGSNGGDGRVAARVLEAAGRNVRIVDAKVGEGAELELGTPDLIVDALFGTGFAGAPRPAAAALIKRMNAAGAPIVSVDIPSGVDSSTGEVAGAAVEATATVTFHACKVGHAVAPGRSLCGELELVDIGLAGEETLARRVTPRLLELVPRKQGEDTKFSAGSVLVVGGSRGMSGAVALAAGGAYRADAGYVTIAAPASVIPAVELEIVEAVKRPLAEDGEGRIGPTALPEILELAGRAHALALGPGLGRSPELRALVRQLLAAPPLPTVADADALDGLQPAEWGAPLVLTPHAGEIARLLGRDSTWVDEHRLAAARDCAARFGATVLLKGPDTIISSPDGLVLVSEAGTPALATAGSGDVLTGVVAAFLAKGLVPLLAAAAAAEAHGRAAELADEQAGLVASDLVDLLPRALASP